MPIYAYRCRSCDHEFEELLWSSETDEQVRCPSCERADAERQLPTRFVGRQTESPAQAAPFCGRCGENRPPCGA